MNTCNPIEVIYLNLFALGQIMTTWVHLSTYVLSVINFSSFKLFNAESAVFKTASVKNTNLKSLGKEIHFSLWKEERTKKDWFQLYLADTQHLTLFQHQYDVKMLHQRWIDVEEAKGSMSSFIWWRKTIHALLTKWKEQPHLKTLGRWTIVFDGNKLIKETK